MRIAGWVVALGVATVVVPQVAAAQVAKAASDDRMTYRVAAQDTLFGLSRKFLTGPRAAAEVQRINRIRDDKPATEADHLSTLQAMLDREG